MPLPRFDYVAADSLESACALLAERGPEAVAMAGGTDLVLHMRLRPERAPKLVVGLRGIRGLDAVRFDPERGLEIGALATLAVVAASPDVIRHYPALATATAATATVQIRNMGTVAGNLCNASPAADTATPLLVAGAEARIVGPGGSRRTLSVDSLFAGPGKTTLAPGELVEAIVVPAPRRGVGSSYERLSGRSRVDIAAVCVATLLRLDEAGRIALCRIALGAVAPVPMRVPEAERALDGRPPTPEALAEAAALSARAARPISDVRASAPYRRHAVQVLTARSLEASATAARAAHGGAP